MIGLLLLTHEHVARGLLEAVEHTLGHTPPALAVFEANYRHSPEAMGQAIATAVARVLFDGLSPRDAVKALMERDSKAEA